MIILDLSQVCLSNLMMSIGKPTAQTEISEGLLRHMILNSIRSNLMKFRHDYGELVIACDNQTYWRKSVFQYYKANRKKNRDESPLDWKLIFSILAKIREELKAEFSYRVIDVEGAEADDVIGSLCAEYGNDMTTPILILSGDKDFIQCQKYMNVHQYDPVRKKKIQHNNPVAYMKEHILRGDVGDGIPNVLSSDTTFVLNERQKPLTTKKLEVLIKSDPSTYEEAIKRNYMRNQQIIDLSFIPEAVKARILESYENQAGKKASNLFNYFMNNKLRNLMQDIGDF